MLWELEDGAKMVAGGVDTKSAEAYTLTTARRVNTGSDRLVRPGWATLKSVVRDKGVRIRVLAHRSHFRIQGFVLGLIKREQLHLTGS